MTNSQTKPSRNRSLDKAASLAPAARRRVGEGLRTLLADVLTLYLKTKKFHWHMTGTHFRDYHLLAMSDVIAERTRKLGERTIRSVGEIARLKRLPDNDSEAIAPTEMLKTLMDDNDRLSSFMRDANLSYDQDGDLNIASLLENWVDETERRSWFLSATLR